MKQCPRCKQTYTDDNLNFCLEDGELLSGLVSEPPPSRYVDDDPPPTMVMNEPRVTNPSNWPSSQPAAWQPPQPMFQQQQVFGQSHMPLSASQTLAAVSLGLGIGSMTIGWCCYLGVLLSPAALITGFIALSQIKRDPQRYTGRGFAIAGIATAAAYVALLILFFIIWGVAMIGGGLN